jgi:GDP-4-dehydro-6-deoxy-D-mannose reductase
LRDIFACTVDYMKGSDMSVWLVTGGAGFLGRHVLSVLSKPGSPAARVIAIGRRAPEDWCADDFVPCDLDGSTQLDRALTSIRADYVIHAAGRTPPASTSRFYQDNTRATIELLSSLARGNRATRVVLVGSAAELGPVPVEALPVAEDFPCRPIEPYGLSKWFATKAGLTAKRPLEVIVARVFNPIGRGMPANQAFGRFAKCLANSPSGPASLKVGDLETRRDFIDVRDVAQALISLAERGRERTIYHVGTGHSHSVGEGLAHLIELDGRAVELERVPLMAGTRGPIDSRANIGRIVEHTGWSPRISFRESLADLWLDLRNHVPRNDRSRSVA